MGLISALTEQFDREKALEQARQEAEAQQRLIQSNYQTLGQIAPIVPTNEAERINLERSGYIPSEAGYITPERQMMQNEREYRDYKAQQNVDAYQNKLQNPLFNIGDTLVDVANNTVGLPLKLLSGGQNPFGDPSQTAKNKFQQSLADTQALHAVNQKHYRQQREARNKTFSESMKGVAQDPSAVREWQFFNTLLDEDKDKYLNVKRGGTSLNLGDEIVRLGGGGGVQGSYGINLAPDQNLDYLANKQRQEAFIKAQSAFTENQPKLQSALKSARQKHSLLKVNIAKALELVRTARGAGWNGLLRTLPESIAKDLDATLTTIKANVAFERLQEMRRNSPTGGALGQVSDREIKLLYNSLMPIDQLGSDQLLENSLTQIIETNKLTLDNMRDAYNQDLGRYGGRPQEKPTLTDEQKNKLKEHDKLFGL